MDLPTLAIDMLRECERVGQSARAVVAEADAETLRALLRRGVRGGPMRIRTARIDDTVAVVRTDAALWTESAATMRRKLQPPR